MSGICYWALYIGAPYIAIFYQQEELKLILRVLGSVVFINAFTLIPRIMFTISMDFKSQTKISIISVLFSGTVALLMAISGYGIWSLVVQTLLTAASAVLLFNLYYPWQLTGSITKESVKYLFGFGNKLLISALLDIIYNNLYQVIIGKKFNPDILGQFNQANQFANVPAMTLTGIIQRVTYPIFSQLQNDTERMDYLYRLALKIASVVIFPLILGLAVIAEPLVTSVLGQGRRMIILCTS